MTLIRELKKIGIIKKGNFTLKSGEKSNIYIDIKKAFGSPKAFRLINDELCKIVDPVNRPSRYGASKKATCIAGSGHGGLPLATAVSIKLGLPLVLVRDKVKKHGIQKMIDGYMPNRKDRIAIIDDVFTTGTCISRIIRILEPTAAQIVGGYVVLNRGKGTNFKISLKSLIGLRDLS